MTVETETTRSRREPAQPRLERAVEVIAAAADAISGHVGRAHPRIAGGVLIGTDAGGTLRVTRALPAVNAAPEAERARRFLIAPAALANVERALSTSTDTLLGIYHSHVGAGAPPGVLDLLAPSGSMGALLDLPAPSGSLWLIVPVAEGRAGAARAWWLDGAGGRARELVVRTLNIAAGPIPRCPE